MEEIRLDEGELFVLAALQTMMLDRDLAADKRPSANKIDTRNDAFAATAGMLDRFTADAPAWVRTFAARSHTSALAAVSSAPTDLGRYIDDRAHAVSILIELLLFDPWPDAKTDWVTKTRSQSLREAAATLPALRENDLEVMEREYRAVTRRLRRASVKWGRVALVSAAGLGLGVVTAGWAAPLIGGAIGSAMGLTGAAATSAGLAFLGGGSLAAGGFGVAGGTALLTGLGGAAGAGAAAAGARVSSWSAGQIVLDAIKLDLYTRMVLDDDDDKARRVVESLHQRISELAQIAEQLKHRIQALSEDNARLTAENKELRRRLRREYADIQQAEAALDIVANRLSDAHDGDAA